MAMQLNCNILIPDLFINRTLTFMSKFLHHSLKLLSLLGLMTGVLAGCATQSVQDLYTGSDSDAVLVQSSGTIQIKYIDNDEVHDGFVGQTIRYQVGPGQHTYMVEYSDLFDVDSDDFDKVVSRPAKITFNAQPAGRYQIDNPKQATLEEAKAFAEKPSFTVIDLDSKQTVEATIELSRPRTFMTQLKSAVAPVYEFESDQVQAAQAPPLSTAPATGVQSTATTSQVSGMNSLQSLKQTWEQATQAERDQFIEWVKTR